MQTKKLEFIRRAVFELLENLPNNGTKHLLLFKDSCEEISIFMQFVRIDSAGRHRGTKTIYVTCFIKENWEELLSYKILTKSGSSHREMFHESMH